MAGAEQSIPQDPSFKASEIKTRIDNYVTLLRSDQSEQAKSIQQTLFKPSVALLEGYGGVEEVPIFNKNTGKSTPVGLVRVNPPFGYRLGQGNAFYLDKEGKIGIYRHGEEGIVSVGEVNDSEYSLLAEATLKAVNKAVDARLRVKRYQRWAREVNKQYGEGVFRDRVEAIKQTENPLLGKMMNIISTLGHDENLAKTFAEMETISPEFYSGEKRESLLHAQRFTLWMEGKTKTIQLSVDKIRGKNVDNAYKFTIETGGRDISVNNRKVSMSDTGKIISENGREFLSFSSPKLDNSLVMIGRGRYISERQVINEVTRTLDSVNWPDVASRYRETNRITF